MMFGYYLFIVTLFFVPLINKSSVNMTVDVSCHNTGRHGDAQCVEIIVTVREGGTFLVGSQGLA